jgi:hypothetical protein
MNKIYFKVKVRKMHLAVTQNISLGYPIFSDLIHSSLSFIGVTFSCSHDSFHPKYKKHSQNIQTLRGQNTDFPNVTETGTRYLYFIEIQLRFLCPAVRYTDKLPTYRVSHSTGCHILQEPAFFFS